MTKIVLYLQGNPFNSITIDLVEGNGIDNFKTNVTLR